MHLAQLAAHLSPPFCTPVGTIVDAAKALRRGAMLSVGRQGPYSGARMSNTDVVNLLLALVIDHKRGDSIAENVQRVRDAPLEHDSRLFVPTFAEKLALAGAKTLGAALDGMLDDMRRGRYAALARESPGPLN